MLFQKCTKRPLLQVFLQESPMSWENSVAGNLQKGVLIPAQSHRPWETMQCHFSYTHFAICAVMDLSQMAPDGRQGKVSDPMLCAKSRALHDASVLSGHLDSWRAPKRQEVRWASFSTVGLMSGSTHSTWGKEDECHHDAKRGGDADSCIPLLE